MLSTIYYSLAIIAYSIFLIQFILTIFGVIDIDSDIDFDGDGIDDLSWGDILSFKGVIHFLMGATGWLSIKSLTAGVVFWYDYLIAFFIGVIFFLLLCWLYKLMMKLENKPKVPLGKELIGKTGTVYLININNNSSWNNYIVTINNGMGTAEYPAVSENVHSIGDTVEIIDYQNGYYIFS